MKVYKYIIGSNPYDTQHEHNTKGNGDWSTTASNMKEALRVIFGTMQFPAEAAGRSYWHEDGGFIEGVSLPGKSAEEVIQVWSNEPDALAHVPGRGRGRRHDGRGSDLGLLVELDVTKLDDYLTPVVALLTGPEGTNGAALSPMGASVVHFEQHKQELQAGLQMSRFEIQQKQWAASELESGLRDKVKALEAQIDMVNTYLHGTRHRTRITTGKSSSGPYHVFQQRQFLDQEVGLLANFDDFDFSDLPALEKWLVSKGHIWKMLPHERCILVTRIRGSNKDYGDPIANIVNNMENMQNMIWIRDGENVTHVDVEFDFESAVFPARDQFDTVLTAWRDQIFRKCFSPSIDRWMGERKTDPPMGHIKPYEVVDKGQGSFEKHHRPEDERYPYMEVRLLNSRFKKVEEWLESPSYSDTLDFQLRQAVAEYLRDKNKKQMRFCVLLQGIVDNTDILSIPKGTDLFNWENVGTYFTLVSDYTHAISDRTYASKLDEYFDITKVKTGDWVIVWLDEHVEHYGRERGEPWLFKVVGMASVAKPEKDTVITTSGCLTFKSNIIDVSGHYPVVMYRQPKQRGRSWSSNDPMDNRVKSEKRLVLNPKDCKGPRVNAVMRVPFSPDLADKILDDREWKMGHHNFIRLMAQYRYVLTTYLKNPVNQTAIALKERS